MKREKTIILKKSLHATLSISMIFTSITMPNIANLLTDTSTVHASGDSVNDYVDLQAANVKAFINEVVPQWRNRVEEIDVLKYKLTWDEISAIIKYVHYENPELYYVFGAGNFVDANKDKIVEKLIMDYPMDRSKELEEEWIKVQEKLQYATSIEEKILVVHDHLCETMIFSDRGKNSHDIEGAILEKIAVCEGYALAFKFYMNKLNIPCKIVTGVAGARGEAKEPHAWNEVQIDGNWYMVDATYDDTRDPKITKHNYFLKSEKAWFADGTETFATTHIIEKDDYEPCLDTKYDEYFWTPLNKEITPYKGSLFCGYYQIDPEEGFQAGLMQYDLKTQKASLFESVEDVWIERLNDTSGSRTYSVAEIHNDILYFNTPRAIYKRDLKNLDKPKELVLKLEGEDANKYIWDIKIESGRLYYDVSLEKPGVRPYRSIVIDDTFKKREQPLAVSCEKITMNLAQLNEIVYAGAPSEITYTVDNPQIATAKNTFGDDACAVTPLSAGKSFLRVSAAESDRYLKAEKLIELEIVKGQTDVYVSSDKQEQLGSKTRFSGNVHVSRKGSGHYYPSGSVKVNVYRNGVKLLDQDVTYTLSSDRSIAYSVEVNGNYSDCEVVITYSGDERFEQNVVRKKYGVVEEHVHRFENNVASQYLASAPTCSQAARYYKSCACGHKSTETFVHGSALEHDYSLARWEWNGNKANAIFTCKRSNCNHTRTIQATMTSFIKQAATCTTKGITTYVANVTFEGRTYRSEKDLQDIAVKAHKWQEVIESKPTCTKPGKKYEKCTHCGTIRNTTVIPTLKHTYVNGVCTQCGSKDPNYVAPAPTIKKGDVNNDGKITAIDYLMIKDSILGKIKLNTQQVKAADVNKDGKVSAVDYLMIKDFILGKIKL